MEDIIFSLTLAVLIIWFLFKPWNKSLAQFFVYCIFCILPVGYMIFGDGFSQETIAKGLLSLVIWIVLVFTIFFKLRLSPINFGGFFVGNKNSDSKAETYGKHQTNNKANEKVLSALLYSFYFLCLLYAFLFKF